jgi:hypothetical protein
MATRLNRLSLPIVCSMRARSRQLLGNELPHYLADGLIDALLYLREAFPLFGRRPVR